MAGAPAIYGRNVRGQWCWVRGYQHPIRDLQQRVRTVRADAAITLRLDSATHPHRTSGALILLDQVLMDWGQVRQRLKDLLAWRESAERWPIYAHFPPILLLATDDRHLERWHRINSNVAQQLGVPPLDMAELVWQVECDPWREPWQRFVSRAPCRLQHLWRDMPEAALPPGMMGRQPLPSSHHRNESRSLHPIVIGRYADRASRIAEQQGPRAACLVSWQLPSALHSVLRNVALLPGIPVADLAQILGCVEDSLERSLRALAHERLVTANEVPTLGTCARLTAWGARVVGLRYAISRYNPLLRTAMRPPASSAAHDAGVYHFCAQLIAAACTQPDHAVLWWETAASCSVRYRLLERWYNLRPDAAGVYRAGYRRIRWWLEWDAGTMDAGELREKFRAYARYVSTRQWQADGIRSLPILLCVAPHYQQFERLRRVAADVLSRESNFGAYITLAERLAEQGPLMPIWGALRHDEPFTLRAIFTSAKQSN